MPLLRRTPHAAPRAFLSLLVCLLPVLQQPAAAAETIDLPTKLGKVVYRQNLSSPIQLFIVADSHRSSLTGANGSSTVQVQLETFRIGAWLIDREQVELLLPEGFFGRWQGTTAAAPADRLDDAALLARLADTTTFVNAELLLHRSFGVALGQVEDRELYRRTGQLLRDGLETGAVLDPGYEPTLTYLQQRRLAAILQGAPAAIEAAFRQGSIDRPRAMLTIGQAHLGDLLRMLRGGEIHIPAPQPGNPLFPPLDQTLQLRAAGIGVAVIVPSALAERQGLLLAAAPAAE
jgi:hypothetical protein